MTQGVNNAETLWGAADEAALQELLQRKNSAGVALWGEFEAMFEPYYAHGEIALENIAKVLRANGARAVELALLLQELERY